MKFLYPQFLWALFALAVPLVVHLFNFKRYKTVYFSNNRVLRDVKQRSKSTRQLQKLLVLLSRLIALAFLVFAFAQPYIPAQAGAGIQDKAVVFYLDNSVSMQEDGANGALLDEARLVAVEMIKALPPETKVQVINNDFEGKQQRYYAPNEAIGLIDQGVTSYAQRDFKTVLNRAKSLASREKIEQVQFFVLSDFQANAFAFEELEWPGNFQLRAIPFASLIQENNLAIDSLWLERDALLAGIPQQLWIRVKNYGNRQGEQQTTVNFLLNEQLYGSQNIQIPAGGVREISFSFLPKGTTFFSGKIELDAPAPFFDNEFHFALNLNRKPKVVGVAPSAYHGPLATFFDQAQYDFNAFTASNINTTVLENADAAIVLPAETPGSGLYAAVQQLLEKGGNVVLFPADGPAGANAFLTQLGVGAFGPLRTGPLRASELSWDDPLYEDAFLKRSKNPDLPVVEKYYSTSPVSKRAVPLIHFSSNDFLLARVPFKNGNLILGSVELEKGFSNLLTHKALIPVLINAVRFSTPNSPLYNFYGRGKGQEFDFANSDEAPLTISYDQNEVILPQRSVQNKVQLYNLPSTIKPGVYDVKSEDSLMGKVALNIDPMESQWLFLTEQDLPGEIDVWSSKERNTLNAQITANFVNASYWRWMLGLALLFFIIELVLLKVLK